MTSTTLPAAILWDMDGTLIDTEPSWMAAEMALAARHGAVWTKDDALTLVGSPLPVAASRLRERGVSDEPDVIINTLQDTVVAHVRAAVPWQADAKALLSEVQAAGVPCALVTMSYRPLADAFIDTGAVHFDAIVTGDEVERGKPDPESYLLAAQRLGVDIARCVVIEDSPSGVTAGYSSGAATIAVERAMPVPLIEGLSRVPHLKNLTLETLAEVAAGRVLNDL